MADIMRMGKEPDYLGGWDLYDVPGNKIQVTIKSISDEEITGERGKKSVETVCWFNEDYKPMILNKTNKKRLARLFKSVETENLVGKRIEICYEQVKTREGVTDALRIVQRLLPQQSKAEQVAFKKCEACGGDIKPAGGMTGEQVAKYTKEKYGQALCGACAAKRKQELASNETDK